MFASAVARRGGAAALAAARRGVASTPQPITVAHGDGIGPEIMESTLAILQAAGANVKPEVIDIGEKLYLSGHTSGIAPSSWESLRRTKIFLKAPITTPLGGGYKSACVARAECGGSGSARARGRLALILARAARSCRAPARALFFCSPARARCARRGPLRRPRRPSPPPRAQA
jgi:hypothetical protein